jgi:hypothetical protein
VVWLNIKWSSFVIPFFFYEQEIKFLKNDQQEKGC